MSVRLSLLAILDQGSCYGYQLRTELDRRTGSRGPVNVGQIYNTLDRLERDKLIRSTDRDNTFEITDAGRDAVRTWFGSASPSDELPNKLALAATLPGVNVLGIIRIQREHRVVAPVSSSIPATAEQLASAIIAQSDNRAISSELALLDEIEELVVSAAVVALPLSTELPKRGRPSKSAR